MPLPSLRAEVVQEHPVHPGGAVGGYLTHQGNHRGQALGPARAARMKPDHLGEEADPLGLGQGLEG
jgi:hypothetical protein